MGKPRAHRKERKGRAGTPHFLPVTEAVQQMAVMGCDAGRWPRTRGPWAGPLWEQQLQANLDRMGRFAPDRGIKRRAF